MVAKSYLNERTFEIPSVHFFYTPDVSRYFDRQAISLEGVSTLILQNLSYGRQEDITQRFYGYASSSFVLSIRRDQRSNIF